MSSGDLDKLYRAENDFALQDVPVRSRYMIAATPRSGSTLLCFKLWQTSALGAPLEYFNFARSDVLREKLAGSSLEGFVNHIEARRTSANGVFGSKIFLPHLIDLRKRFATHMHRVIPDRFVHLVRRDLIGQAVSVWRAEQTGAWTSHSSEAQVPIYDRIAIRKRLDFLKWQDEGWRDLFASMQIPVLQVDYEDIIDDPDRVTSGIAAFLDVSLEGRLVENVPDLKVQRDAVSADWVERFLVEEGDAI